MQVQQKKRNVLGAPVLEEAFNVLLILSLGWLPGRSH